MTRTFLSIYFLPKISYLIWHTSTYGVSQHYPCYVTRLAMLIWRGQYGTATYHPRYRALTVSPDSGSVFFHLTHSQEWHVIEIKRERGKRRYCTLQKWLPLLFFFSLSLSFLRKFPVVLQSTDFTSVSRTDCLYILMIVLWLGKVRKESKAKRKNTSVAHLWIIWVSYTQTILGTYS